jgi:hypothetical protein
MDVEGVDIWYQVEGREQAKIKGFTGQDVDELLGEIKDKEELSDAASTLQPFVKRQDSEEISLRTLEDELGYNETLDFENLVSEYGIWRKNPIIVRPPGTLLSSRLFHSRLLPLHVMTTLL